MNKLKISLFSNNPYSDTKVPSKGFTITEECEPLGDAIKRMDNQFGWAQGLHYQEVEVRDLETNEMLQIHQVFLFLGDREIKTFRTILDPNDLDYQNLKRNAHTWYKYVYGEHYDTIKTELVNTIENGTITYNKMAKGKNIIEEAVVLEETKNVSLPEDIQSVEAEEIPKDGELYITTLNEKKGEYDTSISLPKFEAPSVFKLDGVEYSLKGAEDIGKEIDKKIAQITEDKFDNEKLKRELFDLKQKSVKYRTTSEKVLKNAFKPIKEAIDSTMANQKAIGDKAKSAQERAEEHLKKIENWEEEKERERLEALAKKVNERIATLVGEGGNFNPVTKVISFEFAPGNIYNEEQLSNLEDDEFAKELEYIAKLHADEKKRKQEEESATKQKEGALVEKQRKLRKKELVLNDFEFDTTLNAFTHESGVKVFVHEIDSLSDDDWDVRIEKINSPVPETKETTRAAAPLPVTSVDDYENPFGDEETSTIPVIDPLSSVISGMVGKHKEHQDETDGIIKVILEFSDSNPYFDVMIGRSVLRICPLDMEERADNIPQDNILGVNTHEGLKFTAFKGGSQK